MNSRLLLLVTTVSGVLGSVLLYLAGRRSRVWWRVTAAVLYAVLVSLSGVLILAAADRATDDRPGGSAIHRSPSEVQP